MKKSEYAAIVSKYNMQPLLTDEITGRQCGWYTVADRYIDDLDALADNPGWTNVTVRRETLSPGCIRYSLYAFEMEV